jgi:ferredoxin-NADP reductase
MIVDNCAPIRYGIQMFTGTRKRVLDAALGPHGVDRYLELIAPTWSSTEVRGRIVDVWHQTPDTVSLTIAPNRNWAGFTAGQYTRLTVEIDGVRHTRSYSMATAPGGSFELTVKAHPAGTVSSYLVSQAHAGMVVGLSQAQGSFTLPSPRPENLLLVSGGSGITPVMAMLRALCGEGHEGPITFLHYARTAADMVYRFDLAALASDSANVELVTVFTRDRGGHADAAQLDAIVAGWRQAETYVCGPASLTESFGRIYETAGISTHLHTEPFTFSQPSRTDDVGGIVRFATLARSVTSDGRNLLEQAEAAGLAPEFGCRMGICHTCARPLGCGTVRDVVTGELTSEPGTPIRLCVSAPAGDVDIDL